MNMHVRSDYMGWNDEFYMILACDLYEMVGYKSGMELAWEMVLYVLMEHDVGMARM